MIRLEINETTGVPVLRLDDEIVILGHPAPPSIEEALAGIVERANNFEALQLAKRRLFDAYARMPSDEDKVRLAASISSLVGVLLHTTDDGPINDALRALREIVQILEKA